MIAYVTVSAEAGWFLGYFNSTMMSSRTWDPSQGQFFLTLYVISTHCGCKMATLTYSYQVAETRESPALGLFLKARKSFPTKLSQPSFLFHWPRLDYTTIPEPVTDKRNEIIMMGLQHWSSELPRGNKRWNMLTKRRKNGFGVDIQTRLSHIGLRYQKRLCHT